MANEITVRLKCSIDEICKELESKNFKVVERFCLNDQYFIPNTLKIKGRTVREILEKAILLRNICEELPNKSNIYKLTYKRKKIDENGDILKQDKVDCEIVNLKEGQKFLEVIGYKQIMNIIEKDIVYSNGELEIATKDILNGDKLIEVEIIEDNEKLNTIDKLKQKIKELQLPIYNDYYFIKKAEIELEKILNS